MSVKQHFRNAVGCCVCGTKSSTSRFVTSSAYEAHFMGCFGADARRRAGVICNACVLCVKRHRVNPEIIHFYDVLDTRKGPGPKNIKQINKRKRHKELRERNALVLGYAARDNGVYSSGMLCDSFGKAMLDAEASVMSLNVTGAVLRSATAAAAAAGSSSSTSHTREVGVVASTAGLPSDFECSSGSITHPSFRVPQPPSLVQSPSVTLRNYYKKRVIMCPIKMPDSEEIDELYQEVRKRKQNLGDSFDMPQIHHAMMNQKRRLMLGSDGGSVTSSTDSLLSEISISNAF